MERNIPDMQTLFVPAEILGKPRISAGIRFVMMKIIFSRFKA